MYLSNIIDGKPAEYIWDSQRVEAKKSDFIWRAYLLAYSDESEQLYKNIMRKWNELDAISGSPLVFIFSNEKESSYTCTEPEMQRERFFPDIMHPIAEGNSFLIDMFKDLYPSIGTKIPCLVLDNLYSYDHDPIIINLENDSDISTIIEYISQCTLDHIKEVNDIIASIKAENLDIFDTYCDMKNRIIRICHETRVSVREVELLFRKYEDYGSEFVRSNLIEKWSSVREYYGKEIYGDSSYGLMVRALKIKDAIFDFQNRYQRYAQLKEQLDLLLTNLQNKFESIDIKIVHSNRYVKNKMSSEECLEADIITAENIYDDLIQVGELLVTNSNYDGNSNENSINDYIRDTLKSKGRYEVKDQTRHGKSINGEDAGEVDLLLTKDGKEIALFEGLNLDSVRKDYIDEHIKKAIVNYNALGTATFIVAYVNSRDYRSFWERYTDYLKEYTFPLKVKEKITVLEIRNAAIRGAKMILSRDGYDFPVYFMTFNVRK
ncbi:hypothetical protein [Butyrivibrio fibrisolvens]|uniref:hypothetical protein n=1 Tax=Butyrivibrio fibrisolvens TaxID=831 RepID=UPI000419F30E|nr:hypothetical protein [Butyrivibrio fibrisolvens]